MERRGRDPRSREELVEEIERLEGRLAEAEETLAAIRTGDVDALVVSGPHGEQIFSLAGAERVYRAVVESMKEGAITVDPDGTILFCNRQFGDMVRTPMPEVVGRKLQPLVRADLKSQLTALLKEAGSGPIRRRLALTAADGTAVPVQIAASSLPADDGRTVCLVVTDLTELDGERARLAALLREVRVARERAQDLSRRVAEARETERRAIARELHDEAGQSLTSLLMGLNVLERRFGAQPEVADLRRTAESVLEGLRRLVRDLRPASLDQLGLSSALARHMATVRKASGLDIRYEASGFEEKRLSLATESALFRVVQEALTNVLRHARANSVEVTAERRGDRLAVTVKDDGIGFEPSEPGMKGRMGLLGMRERVEMLGGTLSVESAPGAGTTVVVEVPCADVPVAGNRPDTPLFDGPRPCS